MQMFYLTCLLLVMMISRCECLYGLAAVSSLRDCGKVHLTVSSMREAYLELNWIANCENTRLPDTIALYQQNPKLIPNLSPIKSISTYDHPIGFYVTNISFNSYWLPGGWKHDENSRRNPGPHCFPYWIASSRRKEIIDSNCLKIEPTWMNDNRVAMGQQRIGAIFIPGTHNSGAYAGVPGFLEKYILNQDKDIWTQLVFGIRYLDFRIGYYKREGFFINHDLVRITKLIPLLQQIRDFMELAPGEIVILDLHRFPYPAEFDDNTHRELVRIIGKELGHLVLSPSGLQVGKGPTLNEIWQQNRRLIVCYGQRHIAKEFSWLWNPIQQYWGNKRKVNELKDYLQASIRNHNTVANPMWALMAELTISPVDVIFGSNTNRKLADTTNRHLTKWFRDEWPKDTNIVATDFFLGNDLINVAIEINRFR